MKVTLGLGRDLKVCVPNELPCIAGSGLWTTL